NEPDVGNRRCQDDVPHAFAPDLRPRDFYAAFVTDHPAIPNPLVLAAGAFPVLGGSENALTEQAISLGLQRPVVNSLRLAHLASRPLLDLVRRCQPNPNSVEIVDLYCHATLPPTALHRRNLMNPYMELFASLEAGEVDVERRHVIGADVLQQRN